MLPKASREVGNGERVSPAQHAKGLGERCKLPGDRDVNYSMRQITEKTFSIKILLGCNCDTLKF